MKEETKNKLITGISYVASVALVSSAVCYLAQDIMVAGGFLDKKPAYEETVRADADTKTVADADPVIKISDTGIGNTKKTVTANTSPSAITVSEGAVNVSPAAVSGSAINEDTASEKDENAAPYFEGALFIGDSRTDGLHINTGEKNAVFYAAKGLAVNNILKEKFIKKAGSKEKITLLKALEDKSFRKIYISLGVNELGWAYESKFIEEYTKVVQAVMEAAPDSEIVVQSILPITKKRSKGEKVYTNEKVYAYNELIKEMCGELGVTFGDVVPSVANEEGYLPEEGSVDGIHLKKSYYEKWLKYIEDEGI